tara:strand:+ start:265 stop:1047 length:783 start_codon:yes stop_codon:yes gene_type:complete
MPQGRQENEVNKEALNALTDLYYLFSNIVWHVHYKRALPEESDVYYLRPGGLKELLHKYYGLASIDPQEAGSPEKPLTLERMLPFRTISQVTDESWQQISEVCGEIKEHNNSKRSYQEVTGTPTPQEVMEVLKKGNEILDKQKQGTEVSSENIKPTVLITSAGIGVPGEAAKHYALSGGRKKAVLKILEQHPEPLSAKAWARLVSRTDTVSSDFAQKVSSDVRDINKRFRENLQLDEDLIINRSGYLLNFEELNIEKQEH